VPNLFCTSVLTGVCCASPMSGFMAARDMNHAAALSIPDESSAFLNTVRALSVVLQVLKVGSPH
jgi:hypothetical protein